MGFKFNEKDFIDNNIFKYEEKLNTQFSRFQEQTPMYVTWYNICVNESTLDLGFSNVEKVLGYNSPLKYNEVKNFPVYDFQAVQLNIEEQEQGLDTEFESELIILPNTIVPYPHDFFILEHKGKEFLFEVTEVNYDTIKSHNYYKVTYHIKYVDEEETKQLEEQITGKYTCIVDNIGTEDKCILEDDMLELLVKFKDAYYELSTKYTNYFYNKKYNAFIYVDVNKNVVYDRYLNMFIQKNALLYDHESHKAIYLTNEDSCCSFQLEYDRSIYKAFELKKPKRIGENKFRLVEISNMYSIFYYYSVLCGSVRFTNGDMDYMDPTLIKAMKEDIIRNNGTLNRDFVKIPIYYLQTNDINQEENIEFSEFDKILIKYINNNIESIYDIDLEKLDDELFFDLNWFNFIKIPLVLFCMKGCYKKILSKTII